MTNVAATEEQVPKRTVADIDEQSLQQAADMLGTSSPQDTVNQALREVVRLRMVGEYVALLKRSAAESDESALEADAARTAAWR